MKLLAPRERDSLEQREKQNLVKEETTISARIDTLREMEQTQAKKLQDFQEREFEKFRTQVDTKKAEIAELQGIIELKKAEIEAQFAPLDKQWALFKQVEKSRIEIEQTEQARMRGELTLRGQEQELHEEELAQKDSESKKIRLEALQLAQKVEKDEQIALSAKETMLQEAVSLRNQAANDQKETALLREEARVALREVEIRGENLDRREKELEDRETQVLIKELTYYSPVKKN